MWDVLLTETMEKWLDDLDADALIAIRSHLHLLSEMGPTLGRPYIGGDKKGKKQFYQKLIAKADELWKQYLNTLQIEENKNETS